MQARGWGTGATTFDAAIRAASTARKKANGHLDEVDTAEMCLAHSFRSVDRESGFLTNVHVGVLGLEIEADENVERYSPTLMLANNWSFEDALGRFTAAHAATNWDKALIRVFACDQVWVGLSQSPRVVQMSRGNTYVPIESVTRDRVISFGRSMGEWLARHVHGDGRLTYLYWPSRNAESDINNMLRQWMATGAIGEFAASELGGRRVQDLVARNIRYNLDRSYREEDRLGLIVEDDGDVKLGAIALAALAILEHPQRRNFADEEAALLRTVDYLGKRTAPSRPSTGLRIARTTRTSTPVRACSSGPRCTRKPGTRTS